MSIPSVTQLIPILQTAIGPVILISGVGLLLLSMTNRLGRVVDRSRILCHELQVGPEMGRKRVLAQLEILSRRANLIRLAILLAAVSALLASLLIITLFFTALLELDVAWVITLLFVGCMASLIGCLVVFILDVNQSLAALELETRAAMGNYHSPRQ